MTIDSSEFFWLGLVASLFLGLCVTVFRTRTGRYTQPEATASAPRVPLVPPELWEVSIRPQAVLGAKDEVARKWVDLLPLSGRVTLEDPALPAPSKPTFWRRLRPHLLHRHPPRNPDPESANPDSANLLPTNAQVSMLILMPAPNARQCAEEGRPPPEYAIGTLVYDTGHVMT